MLGQIGVTIIGLLCLSAAANLVSGCSVGDEIIFVGREAWSARPDTGNFPVDNIVQAVRVTETGGERCNDTDHCARLVRDLQIEHMETLGDTDIRYNFVIGGDLKVFDGSGWTMVRQCTGTADISIAFIGTYSDSPPPDAMFTTLRKLLRVGRAFGNIPSDVNICVDASAGQALINTTMSLPEYNCDM